MQHAQGTNLLMVTKKSLGNLDIPVPNLDQQRRIVQLDCLQRREREIVNLTQAKRQQLRTAVMLRSVTNKQRNLSSQ